MLAGLVLALVAGTALAEDPPLLTPGEHWLAATTNHRHAGFTVLVHQPPAGEPWLRVIDLDELGIRYSSAKTLRHAGESYVLPGALTDHEVHVDPVMKRAHFVTHVRPHAPEDTPPDLLLDVRINGVLIKQPLYVKNTGNDLVLPKETLEELRIALPHAYGPFIDDGLPLHALAGENFFLAMDRLYLEMTVPAGMFVTTEVAPAGRDRTRRVSDWSPSMVLGYDIGGGTDGNGERWHTGLADLAISAGTLSCRSRHVAQSWQDETLRLDSSCTADWPEHAISTGIGDHFSSSGVLQQSVSYGGFWVGTDYGLQPYLNLQPTLFVDGNARLPSTVEIWMDQRLAVREEIPPGPFVIDNLPAITGSNALRAVLIDATGRQVLLSTSVYSDPQLLRPGVADWRIEGGYLRPGGSGNGEEYTDRFGALSARMGLTSWLTGEIHAERTAAFDNWNASLATRAGQAGVFEFGVSESRRDTVSGNATAIGYSYRGDHLHLSAREIRRDSNHVSLGYPEPGDAPTLERRLSAGLSAGGVSLVLTGMERSFEDESRPEQRLANARLTFALGDFGQLAFTGTRDLSASDSDLMLGAYLSIPIGKGQAWHSVSEQGGDRGTSTGFSTSPPPGTGAGFRVSRDAYGESERYYAQSTYRSRLATLSASAQQRTGGDHRWDARVNGAILASRAGFGMSRDDGSSFAMIETGPGATGVGVLRAYQPTTRTDGDGEAVVSGLRPYERNRIALDVESLPLSAALESEELLVVPGRRGVVVADFGFRQQRQLLARLQLPKGGTDAIPAGSEVRVNGEAAGLVGYDGTIFVTMPAGDHGILEVRWPRGSCRATIRVPDESGIQDMGTITCEPQ